VNGDFVRGELFAAKPGKFRYRGLIAFGIPQHDLGNRQHSPSAMGFSKNPRVQNILVGSKHCLDFFGEALASANTDYCFESPGKAHIPV